MTRDFSFRQANPGLEASVKHRMAHHNDPDFPSARVFQRVGNKKALITKFVAYCADRPEHADVITLLEPLTAMYLGSDADDLEPNNEKPSYGFVYLLKAHRGEYKIGRTNLVDRRQSELGATASVQLERVHVITTDDPSGVEAYWHKRFQDKRMRGEWFRLSPADVKAFGRWKKVTSQFPGEITEA
jgi:hypothetical protein